MILHVLDAQKRVPPGSACGPCAGDGGGRRKLVFLNPRECKRNSFAKKRIVGSQPSWLTRPAGLQPAPIDPLKACRPSQATSLTSVSLAPLRRDMLPHVRDARQRVPPVFSPYLPGSAFAEKIARALFRYSKVSCFSSALLKSSRPLASAMTRSSHLTK